MECKRFNGILQKYNNNQISHKETETVVKLDSISSLFYKQLFCTKVLFTAFLNLRVCCVCNFLANGNQKKAARKMLMKLTIGLSNIDEC